MDQRRITILGSTGSIGTQALDIIARHPEKLTVHALVCDRNIELLEKQARQFHPKVVVVNDETRYKPLKKALSDTSVEVRCGSEEVSLVAGEYDADMVLTAMVGFAGLEPTISAIKSGRMIALANKETLVVAGKLIRSLAREHSAVILPVDSEHSAIFQCINGEQGRNARKIYLTASGGAFVDCSEDELREVTPEMALRHPVWSMGKKVTIDSATLMNKGFEMIEAHYLFDVAPENIDVVVHRQSIVHSMVGFGDGSVKAQLGLPDMRIPIAYALLFPERLSTGVALPEVEDLATLTFEKPERSLFPCLDLAYQALAEEGTATCALNAANEVAVSRFLGKEIRFTDIPRIISSVLDTLPVRNAKSLEVLRAIDEEARKAARIWSPKN
ncbi:MAG: 1-deoxy-D-xylulose-5-phosphate reductoisomerase [Porphyromonas sp.]|nr:1-deoxy-D-xylulose-5-phosphate reductoisomerase [Bacteroidales bacterium]MDY3101258.1 1-deoxy-D-xylulose-5-phosphate reductoisomerase [Porphyromonas sp.]